MKALSIFDPFSSHEGLISLVETVRKFSSEQALKDAQDETDIERMLSNLMVAQYVLSKNNKKNDLEILNWIDAPELFISPNLIKAGSISILNSPLASILQTSNDDECYLIQIITMLMSGDGIHEHVFLDLAPFKNISEELCQKLIDYANWALAHNHTVNLLWINKSSLPTDLITKLESRFEFSMSGQFYLSLSKINVPLL